MTDLLDHAAHFWSAKFSPEDPELRWSRRGAGGHELPRSLRAYVARLGEEGCTVATVNAYLTAITSAHSIAGLPIDRAALKDNPKGIRQLKTVKPALFADDVRTEVPSSQEPYP